MKSCWLPSWRVFYHIQPEACYTLALEREPAKKVTLSLLCSLMRHKNRAIRFNHLNMWSGSHVMFLAMWHYCVKTSGHHYKGYHLTMVMKHTFCKACQRCDESITTSTRAAKDYIPPPRLKNPLSTSLQIKSLAPHLFGTLSWKKSTSYVFWYEHMKNWTFCLLFNLILILINQKSTEVTVYGFWVVLLRANPISKLS